MEQLAEHDNRCMCQDIYANCICSTDSSLIFTLAFIDWFCKLHVHTLCFDYLALGNDNFLKSHNCESYKYYDIFACKGQPFVKIRVQFFWLKFFHTLDIVIRKRSTNMLNPGKSSAVVFEQKIDFSNVVSCSVRNNANCFNSAHDGFVTPQYLFRY